MGKPKPLKCDSCNIEFTKDGPTSYGARQKCRLCYQRWLHKNGYKICESCKCKLKGPQAIPYCYLCKKSMQEGIIPMVNVSGINKKIRTTINPLYEIEVDLDSIKLLLLRFKNGFNTPVDFYLAADYFIKVFGYDVKLDKYDADAQIIYILKRLKNYYKSTIEKSSFRK